jgi:hypothetical protein
MLSHRGEASSETLPQAYSDQLDGICSAIGASFGLVVLIQWAEEGPGYSSRWNFDEFDESGQRALKTKSSWKLPLRRSREQH